MLPREDTAPRHRRPGRPGRRRLVGALLVGVVVVAGAAVSAGPRPERVDPAARRSVVADAETPPGPGRSGDSRAQSGTATAAPALGPVARAASVLRAWDGRRARAWAEGDISALRELYVDRAGVADVRLLRRYADRGLRVEGLTTQLLAVEVLGQGPGRWRLRVTDRVAAGVAVGARGRLRLPRDQADTRLIVLVRGADGTWRVAEVRPVVE